MDIDDDVRESSEEEVYEYRSKDVSQDDAYIGRRKKVPLNRSFSCNQDPKRDKIRQLRRLRDDQRMSNDNVFHNQDFKFPNMRPSEMDASFQLNVEKSLRRKRENKINFEWSAMNRDDSDEIRISPRNMMEGGRYEHQRRQLRNNQMIMKSIDVPERGMMRQRLRSVPKDRILIGDESFEPMSQSVQASGPNPATYSDKMFKKGEFSKFKEMPTQDKRFDHNHNTQKQVRKSQRPRMQKSTSLDVAAFSEAYDYDDYQIGFNSIPRQHASNVPHEIYPHTEKFNRHERSLSDHHLQYDSNFITKRNCHADDHPLVSQQEFDWPSEYCDDPGILDIPNLSPGYEDFCDIYYNDGIDTGRPPRHDKSDTFDSLHAYRSCEFEDDMFPKGIDKHVTERDNLHGHLNLTQDDAMPAWMAESERIGDDIEYPKVIVEDSDKKQRRAKSPLAFSKTGKYDVAALQPTVQSKVRPMVNDDRDSRIQQQQQLNLSSAHESMGHFQNRGFWYPVKPEEKGDPNAANIHSSRPHGQASPVAVDEGARIANREEEEGEELFTAKTISNQINKNGGRDGRQQDEMLKVQFLEFMKEKRACSPEKDEKSISTEPDRQSTRHLTPSMSIEPLGELGVCPAHFATCCLHRKQSCCSQHNSSSADDVANITVNVQRKERHKSISISSASVESCSSSLKEKSSNAGKNMLSSLKSKPEKGRFESRGDGRMLNVIMEGFMTGSKDTRVKEKRKKMKKTNKEPIKGESKERRLSDELKSVDVKKDIPCASREKSAKIDCGKDDPEMKELKKDIANPMSKVPFEPEARLVAVKKQKNENSLSDEERKKTLIGNLLKKKFGSKNVPVVKRKLGVSNDSERKPDANKQNISERETTLRIRKSNTGGNKTEKRKSTKRNEAKSIASKDKRKSVNKVSESAKSPMPKKKADVSNKEKDNLRKEEPIIAKNTRYDSKGCDEKRDEKVYISDVDEKMNLLSNLIRKKKQQKSNKQNGRVEDNSMRCKTNDNVNNNNNRLMSKQQDNVKNEIKAEKNVKSSKEGKTTKRTEKKQCIENEKKRNAKDNEGVSSDYGSSDYESSDYESSDYDEIEESDYSDKAKHESERNDDESDYTDESDHSSDRSDANDHSKAESGDEVTSTEEVTSHDSYDESTETDGSDGNYTYGSEESETEENN
eukprot:gene18293-20116_t